MKPWIEEDWEFTLTVTEAAPCRIGLEKGDRFTFTYATAAGMCPKTMGTLHTLCEIIRCGGDYTLRGSKEKHSVDFPCADGCVQFHLEAKHIG